MSSNGRDVTKALSALHKSLEELTAERKEINKRIKVASKEIDKLLASIDASDDDTNNEANSDQKDSPDVKHFIKKKKK